MEENKQEGTKSATGWLIATYIFAALGGLLGVCFGLMVYRNKEYKQSHRTLGLIGMILAIISVFVWKLSYV